MAVHVNTIRHGRRTVVLHVADPLCPRIDTIYERPDGQVGTWPGIPAWEAFPSQAPPGTEAVAHVRVPANATSIVAQNIEVIADHS